MLALVLLIMLLASTPAAAAPLAGLIVPALFPTLTGAALGIATNVLTFGLSIGLSFLANELFGKDAPDTTQKVQTTIRASIASRWRHYGRALRGGALAMIETRNGGLNQVIALASHKIAGIDGWRVDTRDVDLDGDGWVTSAPYPSHVVKIEHRPGDDEQTAYASLMGEFPGEWTADHKGNGVAHAYLYTGGVENEKFSEVYPNRIATLQAILRGAIIHDPRTGTGAYSTNLALIVRDFLTHPDGLQVDPAYVDDANDFIPAANDCDGDVPIKAGGTIKRYHGAPSYSLDEKRQAIIGRLLTPCDGDLRLRPNGLIGFSVGVWREPTVTLTDAHVIDYSLADGGGPLRESNEFRLKYTEPRSTWPAVEAEPWRIDSEISEYGEVRTATIEAYAIQHHNHARRIMKIAAHRQSPRWQGSIKCKFGAIPVWDERWIRLQLSDLDIDETFEVRSVAFDFSTFDVTISLASFSAAAYEFDPATEEGTAPVVPDAVTSFALSPPEEFDAIGGVVNLGGGVNQPTIYASWDDPSPRPGVTLQLQYAVAGTEEWQAGPNVPKEATTAQIIGIADGGTYDVRARWAGTASSDWVVKAGVSVTAYIDPPPPVTNFSADVDEENAVTLTWRNPDATITGLAARAYRGTTTTFADATDISGSKPGAPNAISTYIDEPGSGTWRYWVVSENGSGVPSNTPVGPRTVTVP